MGTRQNLLGEAVLTSTNNLCFEQKYEKYQNFLSENFQLLVVKISISLSFTEVDQKWNNFFIVSYLWINVCNINSEIWEKKKSFPFKNERLTEFLQAVRCHI